MSIDLLHRINASERRFRRGRSIIEEFFVEPIPDEQEEIEDRKSGGARRGYYSDLIEKLKEP